LWRVSSVGIELGIATGIGALLGWFADRQWGTGPWLQIVGVIFGVAAGFKGLFREVKRVQGQLARETVDDQ
jgi:ATP synthase protein I